MSEEETDHYFNDYGFSNLTKHLLREIHSIEVIPALHKPVKGEAPSRREEFLWRSQGQVAEEQGVKHACQCFLLGSRGSIVNRGCYCDT